MGRATIRRVLTISGLLAGLAGPAWASRGPEKPHVVVIVADDLGFADVGFNGGAIPTPNIDRLALEGVRLDRFYACPVCSPTRAGLMTGRYPIRYGLMRTVIPPWRDFGLDVAEATLPEALARAGYEHRGIFGKWHLGHRDLKWHPLRRGFTEFVGHYNGAIDYFTHDRDGEVDWHRGVEPLDEDGYSTDLIADHAAAFIRRHAEGGPLFCYVPFNAPHAPLQAPAEDVERFRDLDPPGEARGRAGRAGGADARQRRQTFAAMVHRLDEGVGLILDAIDEVGIAEDTLVWFFSDNGGAAVADNGPLRGAKGTVFEGGTRVAAAARWPAGSVGGGGTVTAPIAYIDLLPTLIGVAGLDDHVGKPLDGLDVLDALAGRRDDLERDLYSFIGTEGEDGEQASLTEPRWKLVVRGRTLADPSADAARETLLFRIDSDPNERADVADRHPEVVRRMTAKLERFRALEPEENVGPYRHGQEGYTPPGRWDIRSFHR